MRLQTSIFADGSPVEQRREAALVVADAVAEPVREHLVDTRMQVRYAAAAAGVSLAVAVVLVVLGQLVPGIAVGLLGVAGAAGYAWWRLDSEPDVSVVGARKRYWTGHVVPQPDGALVYDATGTVATTELEVEQFEDVTGIEENAETFGGDLELPVVQDDAHDVEATVAGQLETTRNRVESAETVAFEAPIADTTGDILEELQSVPADGIGNDVPTDSIDFDLATATEQADQIRETETMAFETDPEETFEALKDDSEQVVADLTGTTAETIQRLNDHVDVVGDITSMLSYDFYCPDCIADDVYAELDVEFDGDEPVWYCETCRTRFDADDEPVPKHRMKDDLVEEIWDRLWIEKDDERRRIYENIEDQKSELEEREFEQRQEAIRTAWSRIKDLRSKIRDLETEAKAERGAIAEIGDVMTKYDRLATERREAFESDVEEALTEIEAATEEAIEDMRNYEEEKIEESQEEAHERAELMRAEERKRHQEKMAKLEDIEATQEDLLEHQKQAHQDEMLLETKGGTSASGLVNKYHLMKGKLFGYSKEGE